MALLIYSIISGILLFVAVTIDKLEGRIRELELELKKKSTD